MEERLADTLRVSFLPRTSQKKGCLAGGRDLDISREADMQTHRTTCMSLEKTGVTVDRDKNELRISRKADMQTHRKTCRGLIFIGDIPKKIH